MAVRRRVARRRVARKGRKGGRRSRIPRSPQMKTYKYIFRLNPQILSTDGQAYVRIPSGLQAAPLNNGTSNSPPTGGNIFNYPTNTSGFPNTIDFGVAFAPKLTDLTNAATYCGMYDAYKIDRVTVEVQYLSNNAQIGGPIQVSMPTFWMYWDQDDVKLPASPDVISRKTGVKKFQPTASLQSRKFSFVPRTAIGALNSQNAVTASLIGKPNQWIDCTFPDVEHYGFKMACQDFSVPVSGSFNAVRLQYTYHVSFRSPILTN